jgi:hypothetical protein
LRPIQSIHGRQQLSDSPLAPGRLVAGRVPDRRSGRRLEGRIDDLRWRLKPEKTRDQSRLGILAGALTSCLAAGRPTCRPGLAARAHDDWICELHPLPGGLSTRPPGWRAGAARDSWSSCSNRLVPAIPSDPAA